MLYFGIKYLQVQLIEIQGSAVSDDEDYTKVASVKEQEMINQGLEDYQSRYSDEGFWEKVLRYAKVAGKEVIEKALVLFYVSKSSKTPLWAKTMIAGALGYFITTLDAVPDLVPMVGFADDIGILTAVAALIAKKVSPDVQDKVDSKLEEWFDNESPDLGEEKHDEDGKASKGRASDEPKED